MSAGFELAGEIFWGTNGAVEAYVEALAAEAVARLGPDDPLAVYLRRERDEFYSGKVVVLDDWVGDAASRERFVGLLDAATDGLARRGAFTEFGRNWVTVVVAALRARIAGAARGAAPDAGRG